MSTKKNVSYVIFSGTAGLTDLAGRGAAAKSPG